MYEQSDALVEPIKEFLLGTASSPLSESAERLLQMVPDSMHFQVSLGVLLPVMNDQNEKLELRVQASFLLWYLYRNHSLDLNPFTVAFREARQDQVNGSTSSLGPSGANGQAKNAIGLASTLDMILTGKGIELATYSPEQLVRQWPFASTNHTRNHHLNVEASQSKLDDIDLGRLLLHYASETTLSISEQRTLFKILPSLPIPLPEKEDGEPMFPLLSLSSIVSNNSGNTSHRLISHIIATANEEGREACWVTLRGLQPTLASFDLITRLLRDDTSINDGRKPQTNLTKSTVGEDIRRNVLNAFLEHCDMMIEHLEAEERGLGNESRLVELDPGGQCATAIQHFCRFCLRLLRSGNGRPGVVWDHEMSEDDWFGMTTIMRSFALRMVRYEAASELYQMLARSSTGRGG